jgi:dTDP-glucose 4,6-dehydratase
MYTGDLAIWLWTILFRGQPNRPYNVGSDEALTILDLANTIKDVVAPEVPVEVAGNPIPDKPVERYVPSIERCKSELDLQVFIPINEAIRRTASWYTPLIHRINGHVG